MRQLIAEALARLPSPSVSCRRPSRRPAQIDAQRGLRPVMRRPIPAAALRGSVDLLRTELFFGAAKPDGVVTDEEFFAYHDTVITTAIPR